MNESYSKGIVYVVVGERDISVMHASIKLVRKIAPALPVTIYHDVSPALFRVENMGNVILKQFERITYPIREENRNSSLWRLVAIEESPYDCTLYLDNDIFVLHRGFLEGFEIAKHYGTAMVQNPRMFIKTYEKNIGDLDIGVDVQQFDKDFCADMPSYMTSYNMGVMFHSKFHAASNSFLKDLIQEQTKNPSRGQAGLYRTIWKTKHTPYCLPINWLVCTKHCGLENPLALHVGHPNILKWWSREFK